MFEKTKRIGGYVKNVHRVEEITVDEVKETSCEKDGWNLFCKFTRKTKKKKLWKRQFCFSQM